MAATTDAAALMKAMMIDVTASTLGDRTDTFDDTACIESNPTALARGRIRYMPDASPRLGRRLSALPPTFTTHLARTEDLSARDLSTLREAGEIDELSRGVYRRSDAPPTAHLDLLAGCARAPHAVACGESALSLHELIDDIPHEVRIAVPRGSHRPSISFPPTTVSQYATDTFDFAVGQFEAAPGETVPVYSAARSVVDAMRLGGAAGRGLALSALSRYLRRTGRQDVADLQRAARELGGMSAIRPTIEAMLA
jgi:hypothetical protein